MGSDAGACWRLARTRRAGRWRGWGTSGRQRPWRRGEPWPEASGGGWGTADGGARQELERRREEDGEEQERRKREAAAEEEAVPATAARHFLCAHLLSRRPPASGRALVAYRLPVARRGGRRTVTPGGGQWMAARGSGRWAPDGDARRQAVPRLETLNQGVHHVPDADHLLVPSGGAAIVGMAEQLRGRCGRRHHRGGGDWERHGAVDAVAGMALADGDGEAATREERGEQFPVKMMTLLHLEKETGEQHT
nr:uncharacterized protein LOC107278365 [Oryza sativa Japonica Group]